MVFIDQTRLQIPIKRGLFSQAWEVRENAMVITDYLEEKASELLQ
jgi:hypothetical protein